MRAKFVNEIVRNQETSGLSSIGIGSIALINVPKLLRRLARAWQGKDFMFNNSEVVMKGNYTEKNGISKIEFDFSYINLSSDKIENPSITYDKNNQKIHVTFGGIKNSWKSKDLGFDLDMRDDDDVIAAKEGLEPLNWVGIFYDNLMKCIEDYGNAYEEKDSDGPPRYDSYGVDHNY